MRIQAKIQKWGNSLGLRLSGPMKSIPNFKANMLVDIEISEHGIEVTPTPIRAKKKRLISEARLLKGLTKKTVHSESIAKITNKEFGE